MASTTLDSACRDGKPRGGHDPGSRSRDHHRLGAAIRRRPHRQRHGVVPPEPLRRRRHSLPALPRLARQHGAGRGRHRRRPLRRNPTTSEHRRCARPWRSARHADGLVRAARDRLPGRPGRHHQAVHRRQGQRRQGRPSSPRSASAGSAPPTTTRPTPSPSCCGRSRPTGACDDADAPPGSPRRRDGSTRARRRSGSWSRSGSIPTAAPARCSRTARAAAPTSTRCWPTPASWCRA